MMTLDPTILSTAQAARERLLERQHELERARADLNHEIRRLHAAGGSMREISEELGLSHQRVHQIVTDEEAPSDSLLRRLADRLQRRGGGAIRFTGEARSAVKQSQEEALALGARSIGPEHLLLALAVPEAGASARALAAAGVQRDALRIAAQDTKDASKPRDRRGGQMPFTPATKKTLELSLREAVRRGDDHVGSEHLLLGLLRGADEHAMTMLDKAGVTPRAIRDAVDALPRET